MVKWSLKSRGFWAMFFRMGGWWALLLAGICCVITGMSVSSHVTANRFEARGVVVDAVAETRRVKVTRDSDGDTKRTYYVTYAFETQSGETIRREKSVGKAKHDAAPEGSVHPIRYLAGSPRTFEAPPGASRQNGHALRWFALLPGVIMLGVVWMVGRWAVAAVLAVRRGEPRGATVIQIERAMLRINNRQMYRLVWRDDTGRVGKSLMARKHRFDHVQPGAEIAVYKYKWQSWWSEDVER